MRSRTKARAWALQVLYAWETQGAEPTPCELEDELAGLRFPRPQPMIREYARQLLTLVEGHLPDLDRRIEALSSNWRLSRMTAIDRNILRIATAEMLYREGIPLRVSLHEAIRLAEWFGTEESSRFINGVLDALLHELEPEGMTDGR